MFGPRHHARGPRRKGEFTVDDANVKHTKLAGGVWDLYEEVNPALAAVPGGGRLELFNEMFNSLPHVWKMFKDVMSIRSCWPLFVVYVTLELSLALIPAIGLRYSGQLLNVVQTAVEKREVDQRVLFEIAAARLACSVSERLLGWIRTLASNRLNLRIRLHYSVHMFHAHARLDVPTFDSAQVKQQLEQASPPDRGPHGGPQSSVAWDTISTLTGVVGTAIQMVSQLIVLSSVLREQRDGMLFASLKLAQALMEYFSSHSMWMEYMGRGGVWAATTRSSDYVRMEGLKQTITRSEHRKELVAGDMWGYLVFEYQTLVNRLGEQATDFYTALQNRHREKFSWFGFVKDSLQELPQIVFTLRAVQYPASVPVSLASLTLVSDASSKFTWHVMSLVFNSNSLAMTFSSVRKLYEATSIPNEIKDGNLPYPENTEKLKSGITVEFRNVSFQYPGSSTLALRDVSFKIQQGQLCIIVGANGSGKSTILKLITRIYDPTEGTILIDDQDIKTLKLENLRQVLACLFQDYTHFPLDIKDNIGVGDPGHAHDLDRIQEAARLGGADGFIEKLAEGYDTYLTRPVSDHYSGLPEGTKQLFGRKVDHSSVRSMGDMSGNTTSSLSGGQMQRIALARTFMKTLVSDPGKSVGLLLFDEPSASLDPKAEHDLFQRLRQLRGEKTMLFSSHRFGNLTRHADIILYMDDAQIVESGTHEQLVAQGGAYAEIWQLSVASFLN